MTANLDPLWKAVVEGDTACPDGEALAKLGSLLREQSQCKASDDFAVRVLAAAQSSGDESDLIDAYYDDGDMATVAAADPALGKLRKIARQGAQPPEPVDLLPEVLDNLHRQSSRHPLGDMDKVTRLRVWATVIAGHAAAIITIVILQAQLFKDVELPEASDYVVDRKDPSLYVTISSVEETNNPEQLTQKMSEALDDELPLRWSQLRDRPEALFLLRQNDDLKNLFRKFYGTDTCQATVQASLSWLRYQQQENGAFHKEGEAGAGSRALATHSLALLALLADGYNDYTATSIEKAVKHLRQWVDADGKIVVGSEDVLRDVAHGMAVLALVESAVLLENETLFAEVERIVNVNLPAQRHAIAGLDGYFLLAVETAEVSGMNIHADDLASIRGRARTGIKHKDAGNLGLMALTRYLYGHRDSSALKKQIESLSGLLPRLDDKHRSDPLSWFFPSLAFREAGGKDWRQWNTALQRSLLPCFRYDNVENVAWVKHQQVQYADNDVFATSLVLLNLQAAHRYIPLARSH